MDELTAVLEKMIRAEVARQVTEALADLRVQPDPAVMPNVFTVAGAAEYCGLSRKTLYNMRSGGTGPKAYKRGRLTVYFRDDLDTWLRQNLTPAV